MNKLEKLIARARELPPMTEVELKAQRDSWVRGEIGFGSDADESAYREALATGDAEALARLKTEAENRMNFFDKTREKR